jgi:hypothetical protein
MDAGPHLPARPWGKGMDEIDLKPGKWRKVAAALLALMGVSDALLKGTFSSRLAMCSMLLIAWTLAFVPAPPLRTPLRDVYKLARAGWRTPWYSKLMTLVAIVLLVVSQYFFIKGR